MQPLNLKIRILAPLAITLIVLMTIFVLNLNAFHHRNLRERLDGSVTSVQRLLARDIEHDASLMAALLETLSRDRQLLTLLARRDAKGLLLNAQPMFEHLRNEHRITHFYFTDTQRINLIRIHRPGRAGDRIDRFTTLAAERSGQTSFGLELGPLGTLTLRVVMPWYDDGRLIGYVELGEEIEHLMDKLQQVTGTEVVTLISKEHLKQEDWLTSMRMLGRTSTWDQLPDAVIIHQTLADNGQQFLRHLPVWRQAPMNIHNTFPIDGRNFLARAARLDDVSGRSIGELIVLYDTTVLEADAAITTYANITIASGIAVLLLALFYFIARRMEAHLISSQQQLVGESEKRERLQHIHIKQLEHLATHDPITGLPNLMRLRKQLDQAIAQAKLQNDTLGIVVVDINRLREINDTLGHHSGDAVLKEAATRLQSTFQDAQTVARIGADEFAIILSGMTESQVGEVVETIRRTFHPCCEIENIPITIETHMGIALFPYHGTNADTLIRSADVAMRQATHEKESYAVYETAIDPYSLRRLALIHELRHAIHAEQLILHFQPQVDLASRRVIGVEALVRWQHPEYGLVAPDEFIPMAEQTGLIRPLTLWVLHAALKQCRLWHEQGIELRMAVNVSARNLLDGDLPAQVQTELDSLSIKSQCLVLEITESALMEDPSHAIRILSQLHDMGVAIAIDDFGTGYSSLAYLSELPVSELKIDRSFIMNMPINHNSVIVRSTIQLAKSLGLRVVAEGVEEEITLTQLHGMDCDAAQGYHISRPLTGEAMLAWLQNSSWYLGDSLPRMSAPAE